MNNELNKKDMASVQKSILAGQVYAHVESVAKSGMSRRILFYRVAKADKGYIGKGDQLHYIENITNEIAWLTGWVEIGDYKQGGKWLRESGLKVNGCGMDMIFHTLYCCVPKDKKDTWSQRYNTL